jgi:hypothetical protein
VAVNPNMKAWFLTNLALIVKSLKKVEDNLDKKYDKINQDVLDRLSKIVDGKDGKDGRDGKDGKQGERGEKVAGKDGKDGRDGDSVVDAKIDFDGSLVITMSTGKEINVGEVVPEDLKDKLRIFVGSSMGAQITPGTLYVDSVNNFVGINDPTPTTPLDVTANALYSGGYMTNVYNTVSGIQSEAKLLINDSTIYQTYTYDALGTSIVLELKVEPTFTSITSNVPLVFLASSTSFTNLIAGSVTITGRIFDVIPTVGSNTLSTNITCSNPLAGGAKLTLSTAGASALSDAVIVFKNTTATAVDWSVGCDHNDTKAFKISRNATLGSNDAIVIRSDTQRVGIGATYATITAPLTVGGVAAFAGGTGALPSIARSTDLDTGIWFPAVNEVAVSTNGSEKLRIISSGNVGIGESVPDYKLDVNGNFGFTPGTSVTPVDNGDVVFELTSNTTFTIRAKGSDGTVRSVALTLA